MFAAHEYFHSIKCFPDLSDIYTVKILYYYLKKGVSIEKLIASQEKCEFLNKEGALRKRLNRGNLNRNSYLEFCELLEISSNFSDEEIIILGLLIKSGKLEKYRTSKKHFKKKEQQKKQLLKYISKIEWKVAAKLPEIKAKFEERELEENEKLFWIYSSYLEKMPYQMVYALCNWKKELLPPDKRGIQFVEKFCMLTELGKKLIIDYLENCFIDEERELNEEIFKVYNEIMNFDYEEVRNENMMPLIKEIVDYMLETHMPEAEIEEFLYVLSNIDINDKLLFKANRLYLALEIRGKEMIPDIIDNSKKLTVDNISYNSVEINNVYELIDFVLAEIMEIPYLIKDKI